MANINLTFDTNSKELRIFKDGVLQPGIESISFFSNFDNTFSMNVRHLPIKEDGVTMHLEVFANANTKYWLLGGHSDHVHFLDTFQPDKSTASHKHFHTIKDGKVQESNDHIHTLIPLEVLEEVSNANYSENTLNKIFSTKHNKDYTHAIYLQHEGKLKIGRFNADVPKDYNRY